MRHNYRELNDIIYFVRKVQSLKKIDKIRRKKIRNFNRFPPPFPGWNDLAFWNVRENWIKPPDNERGILNISRYLEKKKKKKKYQTIEEKDKKKNKLPIVNHL